MEQKKHTRYIYIITILQLELSVYPFVPVQLKQLKKVFHKQVTDFTFTSIQFHVEKVAGTASKHIKLTYNGFRFYQIRNRLKARI